MAIQEGKPVYRFKTLELGFQAGPEAARDNQPYLVDLVTLERLFLQTIPVEISVNPESSWIAIAAAGRNTPLYQYTGGEDSITFTISWYADQEHKEDVIKKCKWLEALARNNGYDEKPHHVQFIMGRLFRGARWIVQGATYKLSMFDRVKDMMPCLATQEITLKRVLAENRSRADILNLET